MKKSAAIYDGSKIRALREAYPMPGGKKLSQTELARRAGISQPYLRDLEIQKTQEPGAKTLMNIAKALGVPYQAILRPTGAKDADDSAEFSQIFSDLDPVDQRAIVDMMRILLSRKK